MVASGHGKGFNIANDSQNFQVAVFNKISPMGLNRFGPTVKLVTEVSNDVDAILVRSASLHDVSLPASVKCIGRAGAGTNNVPVSACTERGIVVFNAPGANANAVKELVIGSMFAVSRNLFAAHAFVRGLPVDDAIGGACEKAKSRFKGGELTGRTLGVIGLGAIGQMVANDAVGLGMNVYGFDPFLSVDKAWGLSKSVRKADSLEALLGESDFVSLHVPLTEKTKGLIDTAMLSKMRTTAVLLNFSRGEVVVNSDVIDVLSAEKLGGYVTDFPTPELVGIDRVIALPHLGASTQEAEDLCAEMVVDQIRQFLLYGNIKNSVNFPDCEAYSTAPFRLIIANQNVPNMVGRITTVLAENGINIIEMLNRSRGDVAYNIMDIDSSLDTAVINFLRTIPGVLMCRMLTSLGD